MNDTPANSNKPGAVLAQERARQNLSVNDVANKLRISIRQIEALEADEYDKLPGVTFVRGFMRNYARLLQLDPEPLLQASGMHTGVADLTPVGGVPNQRVRLSPEPRSSGSSGTRGGGGRKLLSAALALIAAAAAAWWIWQQWQLRQQGAVADPASTSGAVVSQPVQSGDSLSIPVVIPGAGAGIDGPAAAAQNAPSSAPTGSGAVTSSSAGASVAVPLGTAANAAAASANSAAAAARTQPATPAPLGVIRFEFSGAARVEVRDKNDFVIHEELHKPSDITEIQVRPPVGLVIGNAKNVKMHFNGRPIDLTPYTDVSVARFTLSDPE